MKELITKKQIANENSQNIEKDKLRASYALNMCMVSISQIIDYNDIYILEQEYEAILNNINIEMIPKDEALLSIIKRILDTITFFRIQEGDKEFIDKEYQQKMKNAIWQAIPNMGLLPIGGSPITTVISLASQVGIGYMNYRRTKSQNELDYEKQKWQLQRSAIEQFNGLRRELFDTAWRLADKYKYPDEYRLTEKQISLYNKILMDPDEIRKYERLSAIKDKFRAYPPFWYQYGSTANHISRNDDLSLSHESIVYYKSEAIKAFENYWESNEFSLLREDNIASACALEYIDLLDIKRDKEKINLLLDKAVKFSGDANDILQLCAIAYFKIGNNDNAERLFRILVNEEYNIVPNAQILSGIYLNKIISGDVDAAKYARAGYELLVTRINADYLYKLPGPNERIDIEAIQDDFNEKQEDILQLKFNAVIEYHFKRFLCNVAKLIPVPEEGREYPAYYFEDEGFSQRLRDLEILFKQSSAKKKYVDRLRESNFVCLYFDKLNEYYGEIGTLNCIRDREELQAKIKESIIDIAPQVNEIIKKTENNGLNYEDMCTIMMLTSVGFYGDFISELKYQIEVSILGFNNMESYSAADSALRSFCFEHDIPEPDVVIRTNRDASSDIGINHNYFGMELLGEEGAKLQNEQTKYREVEKIIKEYFNERNHSENIEEVWKKRSVLFHDSNDFNTYFEKSRLKKHRDILMKTIAVCKDDSSQHIDVLLTVDGFVPIIRNSIKETRPYITSISEDKRSKIVEDILSALESSGKSSLVETNKKISKVMQMLALTRISPIVGPIAFGVSEGIRAYNDKTLEILLDSMEELFEKICEALIRLNDNNKK